MEIVEGITLMVEELEKYELNYDENLSVLHYMIIWFKNCGVHDIQVTEDRLRDACEHGVTHVRKLFKITRRGAYE